VNFQALDWRQVDQVRCVSSFDELISTPFRGSINALCWPRQLEGDFHEVTQALQVPRGISHLQPEQLQQLSLSPEGQLAIRVMLADLARLETAGLEPVLDCINDYLADEDPSLLRTDVCSWHVDSATGPADTYLCTYHGASSEAVLNADAVRHVDIPETRRRLLADYGGEDDADFQTYLEDHFYSLHYSLQPQARGFHFGIGHLWRISLQHPGATVPPCIHRAPDPIPGQKRLLLIS
jgi:hypothetical protein